MSDDYFVKSNDPRMNKCLYHENIKFPCNRNGYSTLRGRYQSMEVVATVTIFDVEEDILDACNIYLKRLLSQKRRIQFRTHQLWPQARRQALIRERLKLR